jgi:hypothetical protein
VEEIAVVEVGIVNADQKPGGGGFIEKVAERKIVTAGIAIRVKAAARAVRS